MKFSTLFVTVRLEGGSVTHPGVVYQVTKGHVMSLNNERRRVDEYRNELDALLEQCEKAIDEKDIENDKRIR